MNKNILIGVTGCISAYKTAELIRLLHKNEYTVRVIMTKNAKEFITQLTLQTLSQNIVYTELFDLNSKFDVKHIELARWADAIVIAPTSANFIAKLANGLADDLLSTVCIATDSPIAIAPSMNKEMWSAATTQKNINTLKKLGFFIFGPDYGEQACSEIGLGRMLEPKNILELMPNMFSSKIFCGKKILITAGPTQEAIDPVRYISNYSSGKMGYALACAAQEAGSDVFLISGPTNIKPPEKVTFIETLTANEMHKVVMSEIANYGCDIFISSAAVSDYQPKEISLQKIKKHSQTLTIELERNPDILYEVALLPNRPFVVGFSAETENILENSKTKLNNKKLDMIIANKVGKNEGFMSDENSVVILRKKKPPIEIPKMQKTKLAKKLIELIYKAYVRRASGV